MNFNTVLIFQVVLANGIVHTATEHIDYEDEDYAVDEDERHVARFVNRQHGGAWVVVVDLTHEAAAMSVMSHLGGKTTRRRRAFVQDELTCALR